MKRVGTNDKRRHRAQIFFQIVMMTFLSQSMIYATDGTMTGSGTESDPFLIMDYADLKVVGTTAAYTLNAVYRLNADIDASPSANENNGAGFVPIGNETNSFTGIFRGAGHVINNLNINCSWANYIGLFGYMENGFIDSLRLTGVSISGCTFVGGIIGTCVNVEITNCQVVGSITGYGNMGGLAGSFNGGIVKGCYTNSSVITKSSGINYGGLIGLCENGTVNDCHTIGSVIGFSFVGALIGQSTGEIKNCSATGSVTTFNNNSSYIGGLIGHFSTGTISDSYATGAVTSNYKSTDMGGLIGLCHGSPIVNCFATGDVTGNDNSSYIGGLVGNFFSDTISKCFAAGSVFGKDGVGGLIGFCGGGVLYNCYATGSATSSATGAPFCTVGGLVGDCQTGTLENCYSIGSVKGSGYYVGGLLGYQYYGILSNCCWDTVTTGQANGCGASTIGIFSATGLSTAQMKKSSNFSGWDFGTTWIIRTDSTYPGLRSLNNAPFAFADTFSTGNTIALSKLLLNDCDIETAQNNLVLKATYMSVGVTNITGTLTFSSVNGLLDTVKYRIGEVRTELGDTLWGNIASAIIFDTTKASLFTINSTVDTTLAIGRFKGQIVSTSTGIYRVIFGTDSTDLTSYTSTKPLNAGILSICDTISSMTAGTYYFKFVVVNSAGTDTSSCGKLVVLNTTSIADNRTGGLVPRKLTIANYPNPFNPTTTIQFSVEKDGKTIVKAFDILGREVMTLYNNAAKAGQYYTATFNGSRLSSGVYFYTIESNNQRIVKKMLMLK